MNNEKWNEICFLLFDSNPPGISESDFEKNVVQALRVLGWDLYSGDIEIRPSLPIGAANKIAPDVVIKTPDNKKLFVIEIKQPSISLTSKFQQQLFSYMRQLRLEYGILIGQEIQIFYEGSLANQDYPILLETINFTKDNEKGLRFVEFFSKDNFNPESLKSYTISALNREKREILTKKLLSESYENTILELIRQNLLNEYDRELIDSVLNELKIEIKQKHIEQNQPELPKKQLIRQSNIGYHSGGTLPIELYPASESEFKRRLLLTKKAYITTFYNNGRLEQKVWNAQRFSESSGVLGNLRSRLEFRNGEWQKRGIERVYVSIDKNEPPLKTPFFLK